MCCRDGMGIHIRFKPECHCGLRVRIPSAVPCRHRTTGSAVAL